MKVDELKYNSIIKADRWGMAAISYIFQAFGDFIRSKEYWPWGETVNCEWEKVDPNIAFKYAKLCLEEASGRAAIDVINELKVDNNYTDFNNSIDTTKDLRYVEESIKDIDNINDILLSYNENINNILKGYQQEYNSEI